MNERHYLKDALPRLYCDAEKTLRQWERHDLLEQLPHLYITGRCNCGSCSDFRIDSDLPGLNKKTGSNLLPSPSDYEMDHGFCILLARGEGSNPAGELLGSYIYSIDLGACDYDDFYIHKRLNEIGFIISRKLPRVRRPSSLKRRKKLKNLCRHEIRYKPCNPLSRFAKLARRHGRLRPKPWIIA